MNRVQDGLQEAEAEVLGSLPQQDRAVFRAMLQRVVEGARQAKRVREVIVATDDERIAEACRGFGAPVVMTSPEHPTATSAESRPRTER